MKVSATGDTGAGTNTQMLCPQCDLVVNIPPLSVGQRCDCPRCHTELTARHPEPALRPALFAISSLIMLLMANLYPFITMQAVGNSNTMLFIQAGTVLFDEHYQLLSLVVLACIQGIPAFCMLLVIYLSIATRFKKLSGKVFFCRLLFMLKPWCMVEIFLIAILVSFVKLVALAEISLDMSFWAFCLFCVLQIRAFQQVDKEWLWDQIQPLTSRMSLEAGKPGIAQGAKVCRCCSNILPLAEKHCPRCHARVHARTPYSLQMTLALLITAVVLYIPANILPMMATEALGNVSYSTIMEGVILLWGMKSYPVALVIFIASILVPLSKMLVLFWLCWTASRPDTAHKKTQHFLYEMVEIIGRWSMVDVFVISILAALVRIGRLMSIYPGMGAMLFAGVVIITMLSAFAFDPRLFWDSSSHSQELSRES